HSVAFKAKVGFEALVGLKTVSQLVREYAVHPTQMTQWRATIWDHMPACLGHGQSIRKSESRWHTRRRFQR
ncbi:MAG: hypothetical protein ACREDS_01210, partial [Limisphaerales bacterium]